jgi:hypothetical protein
MYPIRVALLVLAVIPASALADPRADAPAAGKGQLSYSAYVAGLHVFSARATVAITPQHYAVDLDYRTTGLYGALVRGNLHSTVQGSFIGDTPAPQHFFSDGWWHGGPRETLIDYHHGLPDIRVLIPPNLAERDPVPAALEQGATEPLSAVAMLVRRLGETGRCEGSARLFDGRRLSEITVHTAGQQMLQAEGRSSFHGAATRCDFVGVQLAGFMHDADASDHRPQYGSAWLAPILPATPPLPVRLSFHLGFLGDVTMYLTDSEAGE